MNRIASLIGVSFAFSLLIGVVGTHAEDTASQPNISANDAYLLGLSSYYRRTPADNAKAATHFKQAIELNPNYSAAYTALAKVYAKALWGEADYSRKLGVSWLGGFTKAWRFLEKGMAQPDADFHVILSWFALRKHQHDRAIAEAQRALELDPNDPDALEALAEALIYAGQPKAGIELAQKALRRIVYHTAELYLMAAYGRNPTLRAGPLYLMGLAEFAMGHPDTAVEHLEIAVQQAPKKTDRAVILAAAYGELDNVEQAKAAFEMFKRGRHRPNSLAESVVYFPFSSRNVLDRLANGLRVAGARADVGGYLPIYSINKLSGREIEALLFGRKIEGKFFWWTDRAWLQQRTADGAVEHSGYPIHAGTYKGTGVGRIEDDMLCERWPKLTEAFDVCVTIYRVPEGNGRIRWGDYVMVTDSGPHPFSVVE